MSYKFYAFLPDRDMQVVCRGDFDIIGNYGIGIKLLSTDNGYDGDVARFWYNLKGRNPLTKRLDELFNREDEREYGRSLNIPLYEIYEDALLDMNKVLNHLTDVLINPTEFSLAKSRVGDYKNWEEYFAYMCTEVLGDYSDLRLGAGFTYLNDNVSYKRILDKAQYINRQ